MKPVRFNYLKTNNLYSYVADLWLIKVRHTLCVLILLWITLGCSHDSEIEFIIIKPELNLLSGDSLIYSDTIIQTNIPITFKLNAKTDSLSTTNSIKIICTENNVSELILDTIIQKHLFYFELKTNSNCKAGCETWMFEIGDNQGQIAYKSIELLTVKIPIHIEFINGDNYVSQNTFLEGETAFTTGIIASANIQSFYNLSRFEITRETNDSLLTVIDSTINCKLFTFSGTFKSKEDIGSEKWLFKITDEQGICDSVSYIIYTEYYDLFEQEETGVLWNFIGDSANIWDLISDKSHNIDCIDSVRDMINSTLIPSESPYHFVNGWHSENRTLFVKDNNYNYEQARLQNAIDAFAGSTIISGLSYTYGLQKDDVFVCKLRSGNRYAVIKIDTVIITDNDNLDRIKFSYKK